MAAMLGWSRQARWTRSIPALILLTLLTWPPLACGGDSAAPTENLGAVALTGIWQSTFNYQNADWLLVVAVRQDSAGNLTGICQWPAPPNGPYALPCQGVSGNRQSDGSIVMRIEDGVCFGSPHAPSEPMSFVGRLANESTLDASLDGGCGPNTVQFRRRTSAVPDGLAVAGAYQFVGTDTVDAAITVTGTITLGVPVDTSVLVSATLAESGGSSPASFRFTPDLSGYVGAIGRLGAFTADVRDGDQHLSIAGMLRGDTLAGNWTWGVSGYPPPYGPSRKGTLTGVRARP